MTLKSIFEKIKNNHPITISSPYKKAAVAIIIREIESKPHIIVVLRSESLKEHPGQISFPGGRIEEADDDLLETAIRETEEEIGIQLSKNDCIGRIDDFLTNTSYHVIPFVFYYKGDDRYTLSNEHEDLFEVDLNYLIDIKNEKSKKGFFYDREWELFSYQIHNGRIIWGATGCMLNDFLTVLRS